VNALPLALSPRIELVVYGRPAPQGSKSFKGMSRKGHAILVESSKRAAPWRQLVHEAALQIRNGAAPLDGPLTLRMVFTVPKPASAPKRQRTWPDRMPDLSKLCRATEDALVSSGLIADDARIVEYERLAKVYAGEDAEALEAAGVRISISEVLP